MVNYCENTQSTSQYVRLTLKKFFSLVLTIERRFSLLQLKSSRNLAEAVHTIWFSFKRHIFLICVFMQAKNLQDYAKTWRKRKKKQNVSTFEIPSRLLPFESRFFAFSSVKSLIKKRDILRQTNRSGFYDKYFFSCFNDEIALIALRSSSITSSTHFQQNVNLFFK